MPGSYRDPAERFCSLYASRYTIIEIKQTKETLSACLPQLVSKTHHTKKHIQEHVVGVVPCADPGQTCGARSRVDAVACMPRATGLHDPYNADPKTYRTGFVFSWCLSQEPLH